MARNTLFITLIYDLGLLCATAMNTPNPAITATCGGSLTAVPSPAFLTSPGYPNNYQNNMDCVWTIHTRSSKIHIEVLQSKLESSSDCSHDYVKVLDGTSSSSQEIGKFCGSQTHDYYSTGHDVTIKFHTDNNHTFKGFKLRYSGYADSFYDCGWNIDIDDMNDGDELDSGYPSNYQNNVNCTWILHTKELLSIISLVVLDMALEYSPNCSYDYLEAFDGYDVNAPSLGRWCGSDNSPKQSSGQYMVLMFITDGYNTDKGFRVRYNKVSLADPPSNVFSDSDSSTTINLGALIGGVIGAIVLIIVVSIILIVVFILKKKSARAGAVHYQKYRNPGNVYAHGQGQQEMSVPTSPGYPNQTGYPQPANNQPSTGYTTTGYPQTEGNQQKPTA